jgi:molybdate transport system substrate-binding protein
LHTETMCARRRSAPTGERRCSDSAAAARCNSEFSSENRRGTVLKRTTRTVAIIAALAILSASAASAAELKVLGGGAMRAAVKELAGTLEASSGHQLVIEYGTVAKVAEKVMGDYPIDVAILTQPFFDQLVSTGKMVGGTTAQLARVPIGVAVSQGTPKPDISSVEAFKRALLDAKVITYGDPGMGDAAGVHVARIVEALGLSGEMRPKTRLISPPPGQSGAQFLTGLFQRGETEVVMAPISVLIESQGGEIVGLLPAELQPPNLVFFAAMPWTCRQPFEAKTLIDFLAGASAKSVYRTKGMDPG